MTKQELKQQARSDFKEKISWDGINIDGDTGPFIDSLVDLTYAQALKDVESVLPEVRDEFFVEDELSAGAKNGWNEYREETKQAISLLAENKN